MSARDLFIKGNKLSKSLYASYKPFNMVDGDGVRCSIYLSGCLFNCEGCYNKSIQNFSAGEPFSDSMLNQIIKDLEQPYCDGLSILGGDPLFNIDTTLKIVMAVREKFKTAKTIWLWTGFTFQEIRDELLIDDTDLVNHNLNMLINNIDVLIDGKFSKKEFFLNLTHRGSFNQKIIDVRKSLLLNEEVLWNDGEYLNYDKKIIQKNHD